MESDPHSNPAFRHISCALLCDLRSEGDRMETYRVPASACVFYQQTAEAQESSQRTQINHFVERH